MAGLNNLPEKQQKPTLSKIVPSKPKPKAEPKKESFVNWYAKNKTSLQEEFPELSIADLTKIGLTRYKEETAQSNSNIAESSEGKKRKLSNQNSEQNNVAKRSTSSKLSDFAFNK